MRPTTKEEIRERFDDAVTDRRVTQRDVESFGGDESNLGRWYLGRYAVSHTSGSQGPPLWIVQDRACLELMFAIMSARSSVSQQPGILEGIRRLIQPRRVAIVAFRRGFYPSGASLEFMREIVGPYVRVLRLSSMQPDLVERLREFQPHVLSGYASVLEALAHQHEELQFRQLQQITNSSEQLASRARRRIEEAFGVMVLDHYGTGECLMLADGCNAPAGGMHVNADWAILEVVDDDYRPVPPDTLGARILVTNLSNRVQPFIRYEIGDRVSLAGTSCRCGSQLPRIGRMEGRNAELFWVEHDGRRRFISGILFHAAADALGCVREWQAMQAARNRIELRLEILPGSSESWGQIERRALEKLTELGLPESVLVEVVRAVTLTLDPFTGKLRRMISQVGPPVAARTLEIV